MLSKDGVILALAFEQVQLTKIAKLLLFIVTASIIGAYFSKEVLKNYSHIKGVAEDFLKAVDIRGSLKEAITDIAYLGLAVEMISRAARQPHDTGLNYG